MLRPRRHPEDQDIQSGFYREGREEHEERLHRGGAETPRPSKGCRDKARSQLGLGDGTLGFGGPQHPVDPSLLGYARTLVVRHTPITAAEIQLNIGGPRSSSASRRLRGKSVAVLRVLRALRGKSCYGPVGTRKIRVSSAGFYREGREERLHRGGAKTQRTNKGVPR